MNRCVAYIMFGSVFSLMHADGCSNQTTSPSDCNGSTTLAPEQMMTWYNLTANGTIARGVTIPCLQCRRGFFPAEQTLKDSCTNANFTVHVCRCFEIYCTGLPSIESSTNRSVTNRSVTRSEDSSVPSGEDSTTTTARGGSKLVPSSSGHGLSSRVGLNILAFILAAAPSGHLLIVL
eukprot:TRINITY_DN113594_c0_g1_i1.p1 TRINITY_DN113594_c0_g1~~TRINITY_DN113594_c0_g1_i1.p1  ORF type:complete len:177 (+),score=15.85 TRINITY_DN113594_c0_g1_i1:66-596(+)